MGKKKPDSWVIFAYDVPNKPSRFRLRIWRDLKKSGALYPSLSFCILPKTVASKEHASSLKSKISEYGKAVILDAKALNKEDHDIILDLFKQERERQYNEILEECQEFIQEIESNITNHKLTDEEVEEMEESFDGLGRWFARIKAMDWDSNPARRKVEVALKKSKDVLTDFAERVQRKHGYGQGELSEKKARIM